jgi:hypothetical protein
VVSASFLVATPAGANMLGFFKQRAKALLGPVDADSIDTFRGSFSLLKVWSGCLSNALKGTPNENPSFRLLDGRCRHLDVVFFLRYPGLCLCLQACDRGCRVCSHRLVVGLFAPPLQKLSWLLQIVWSAPRCAWRLAWLLCV